MRHTPKLVTLALLLMAAVGPGAAAEEPTPPVDEATALHMNAAHSGAVDGSGQTPPLVQRWDRDLGDLLSYPVVTGGRVFVVVRGIDGGYGTTLHGLDAQTGEDLWEPIAISGSWYWSGITAGDGRIYVLSGDGRLTAFDQATGALVWTVKHANMFASSEPTFYDGVVYAGGSGVGGVLYAADASDGHLLWSASLMNSDHSSPAVTEDAVFTGSTCEDIRAFDRLTGMKLWQHPSSCTGGGGRTVAVADGKVWARQPFGSNLVLDVATGAEVGTFASGPLPAFHDGRGFFLEGSTLRARSTSTLVAQWSFPSLDSLVSAPIVVNGNVYIGTQSGKLHVLDEATGELMWTTDVGSPIRPPDEHNVSEPVTGLGAGEGLIVVPATDRLVAYESLHSRLEPLTPARILDTRPTGPQRGYTGAKPAAGATLLVDVLGQGGVPETHVSAAVLTVTAVQATRPGFVTAWPSGTPRPATSNLNLAATGETLANEVIVPIGSDGKIALRTSAGAHLVVDVTGYFTPVPSSARGRYTGVAPARVFDTRVAGLGGPTKPAGGSARTVPITGHGGIPDTGVGAVAVNLTATSTARDSYVTAWPSGSPKPLASSLNVAPGKTVAASAILPVGPDGAINLYTSGGSHLLVDVMGWFSDDTAVPGASGLFVPVAPVRVRDTRTGTRPAGGTAVQVPITATPSVFDATARSAVFNLTATQPAASGYLTAYPHGSSRPSSSNLNMSAPGQTIANLVVGTLGGDGATSVYTSTSSHVIVDLMGYFLP